MICYLKFLEKLEAIKKMKDLQVLSKQRGAIFVLTALLLPVIFGCLGFAYDVGNLYMHKARLQNVTDAAALAGGSVFGEKAQGTDSKTGTTVSFDFATSPHKEADDEARKYINNNKINLGNDIKVEELSALAYPLDIDTTNGVVTQKADVYYRVIASEKVPLYFIPVILDKHEQEVRTVSVALTKTTKVTTPGSNSGETPNPPTVPNASIFDNLFTYSQAFDAGLATTGNDVHASFKGNMVFTYGDGGGTDTAFYEIPAIMEQKYQAQHYVDHLFESKDADVSGVQSDILNNNTSGSSGWAKVNDPIINTYFSTTAYVNIFRELLNQPHIMVKKGALTADNINDYENDTNGLYHSFIKIDGHMVFKGRKFGTPYLYYNNVFYACNPATNDYIYLKGAEHIPANRVTYHNWNNKYFATVKDGDKYYLLNSEYEKTNCYIENGGFKLSYSNGNGEQMVKDLEYDQNDLRLFYRDNNQVIYVEEADEGDTIKLIPFGTPLLKPDAFDPQTTGGDYYNEKINSNIFYISNESQGNNEGKTSISIEKPITFGNPSEPIYILIDENISGQSTSVNLKITNNIRPVIVIYFGTKNVLLEDVDGDAAGETKLTVYAPYGTFGTNRDIEQITFSGKFRGNVIAKNVGIQAAGSGTWIQENYFKNGTDAVSEAVRTIDRDIEDNIKKQQIPDSVKTAIANAYASIFGQTPEEFKETMFRDKDKTKQENDEQKKTNHLNYSKLGYEDKQSLYSAWKQLVLDYPLYKDMLWPWNDHFDLDLTENTTPGETTVKSNSTLRLINPRTETNPYYDSNSDI